MSRVAKQCLDYSITLIKINFMFILVLQAMKLLIGMTDVSQQEQQDQQMRPIITNSSYDNLSQYSSFHDYLKYLSRLWTSNSYDINLMEATKTEIVNVYDEPSDSGDANFAADGSTPLVTFKSFVNFTEFIQYNNLKNMIKLAFVLNLNLTTLITNLIVISYLLVNRRAFYFLGIRLGRRFVRANLVLNLTLLVLLLALNTLYLFAFNDYFKKHSSLSTLNKYIHNYISQIFKSENLTSNYGNELPNFADYSVVELKSKLSTAIEYTGGESSSAAALAAASAASAILDPSLVDVNDGLTTESSSIDDDSSCDRFLATLIIKINLALMLFLISLLTFYSYFLNVEGDEDEDEENECGESSMYDKPISKRYESSCYTSSSDESVVSHDEKKKLLKCNSTSSLPCVVVSDVELVESEAVEEESPFVRLKQKKNRHQIEFNLLWIIHSLFVIYVLSIWDVSDVYHYFKVQNWENTNLNLFKQAMEIQPQQDININQSDSTLLKSLIGLNEKNASIASQIDSLRNDSSFAGTVSFYNDYVNSYHDNFYHHSFQHSRQNDYSRHHHSHDDEEGSNYSEEFKTTTTIRALFILKIHSKLLSCLLVGFFSALVLYKICRIEQLLEFDFERFKREQYSFKRKFIDI